MRQKYIDLLRLIALYYMFFQHCVIGILNQEQNNGIIYFLNEIVPLCPSLFLLLAGFSLTLSINKNNNNLNLDINKNNLIKIIKKGFFLIFAASLLFILEHGFQFPDFIFSSGILNTIGITLIISIFILKINNYNLKFLFTFLIIIILSFVFIYLEKYNIFIFPFNEGYEPIIPTIIFGFIGLFIGLINNKLKEKSKNSFFIITGIISFIIFIYYNIKFGFLNVYNSDYGKNFIERIFNEKYYLVNIFNNNFLPTYYKATIWNYNTNSFLASIVFCFSIFSLFYFLNKNIISKIPDIILIPAKYSLFNYFFHLSIIAILSIIFGYNSFNKFYFLVILFLLYLFSYIFSIILDKFLKKIRR